MAITTLDLALAGMQNPEQFLKVGATMEAIGVMHSFFYTAGMPGAAVAPSPGVNGAALTTYAGQIPFSNPVSGNTHLAMLEASATVAGTLLLVDRLWQNSGLTLTTTTEQTFTTPTWPARDTDGATAGRGVMVGLEVSGATGNVGAIANTTLRYTNTTPTGSRTATMGSFPATAVAGTFVPFQLAAGDVGVQSIQGITLGTSYVSGAIHVVAYRVLAALGLTLANAGASRDFFGLAKARLYNNSVPSLLWVPSATTAVTLRGSVAWTQG